MGDGTQVKTMHSYAAPKVGSIAVTGKQLDRCLEPSGGCWIPAVIQGASGFSFAAPTTTDGALSKTPRPLRGRLPSAWCDICVFISTWWDASKNKFWAQEYFLV